MLKLLKLLLIHKSTIFILTPTINIFSFIQLTLIFAYFLQYPRFHVLFLIQNNIFQCPVKKPFCFTFVFHVK